MTAPIPYIEEPRPDTGVTNGTLGILLFLASELMFFGALVASYTLLRISATTWQFDPHAGVPEIVGATLLLLIGSLSITFANRRSASDFWSKTMLALAGTFALAFLGVKSIDLIALWTNGLVPGVSTAAGLFYAFSGLHAAHVLGGGVWSFSLLSHYPSEARKRRGRLLLAYWTFVDLVWIAIVVLFYIT